MSDACPSDELSRQSICNPLARRRASAGPRSLRKRPPPAAGLMIARYLSCNSELFHRRAVTRIANLFCQSVSFYLHRGSTREVFLPEQVSAYPLEVRQAAIAGRHVVFN